MPRPRLAAVTAMLVLLGALAGFFAPGVARADTAPLDPAAPTTPVTAAADPLPTVQINGVAWSQVVVGDTVYVAGRFTSARPAGARAGTQETVRNNLLAYDIRTGALITSFAPSLNAQAISLAASPDGSRLYVGGDFTVADGQPRYRVAAFSTSTGQLIPGFAPAVDAQVRAIAASDTTVYLGGNLSAVGSAPRCPPRRCSRRGTRWCPTRRWHAPGRRPRARSPRSAGRWPCRTRRRGSGAGRWPR